MLSAQFRKEGISSPPPTAWTGFGDETSARLTFAEDAEYGIGKGKKRRLEAEDELLSGIQSGMEVSRRLHPYRVHQADVSDLVNRADCGSRKSRQTASDTVTSYGSPPAPSQSIRKRLRVLSRRLPDHCRGHPALAKRRRQVGQYQ